mmetsp:Transcript_33605/g.46991  ORF Transcript_33605/g.46991 Transcript_33605/m.46991 type:complete len:404 (+) Transcript_33605:72-1283(+)
MLISRGLVNAVDFDDDDEEGFGMGKDKQQRSLVNLLEHSPPKKLLSIEGSRLKEQRATNKSAVASAKAGTAATTEDEEQSKETKEGEEPAKDAKKVAVARRQSVSAFFVKQKVVKSTGAVTANVSSLSTLLERTATQESERMHVSSRRSGFGSSLSSFGSSSPRAERAVPKFATVAGKQAGVRVGEGKSAASAAGISITVLVDMEEPPIALKISREDTVDDVILKAAKLAMLDVVGKKATLLLVDEDGEIEHLPLQGKMKIEPLGTSFYLSIPEADGNEKQKEGVRSSTGNSEKAPKERSSSIKQGYSEYRVVKTNVRGKRQERILGIDAKYLHNKKPGGSGGGVWRKQRSLQEVTDVTALPESGCFSIVFSNGTKREYECVNMKERDEIVEKIKTLKSEAMN